MLRLVPTSQLMHVDRGWSRGHAHARMNGMTPSDPGYLDFGALRLCALEDIDDGGAFEMHPHKNVEIVTIVLKGTGEHVDSTGATGLVAAGAAATMSAGSGVEHSERAIGNVRAVQIWLEPRVADRKPSWQSRAFPRGGGLVPVASGFDRGALPIDVDAAVLGAQLAKGMQIEHDMAEGGRCYLLVCDGEIRIGDEIVRTGERALIEGPEHLIIRAEHPSEIVMIDMPRQVN